MTDQDAREAREWAEFITSMRVLQGEYASQASAAARFILDNTDPPLPDQLFLAKATHPEYGEGVVISHFPSRDGKLRFMFSGESFYDGTITRWVDPSTLTFHTPDHPEFLESEEDYRNAPEGTITVTLPADPHVWLSGLDSDGRKYVRDVNDNEICYEPGELETLALHLLAYDRKERR